jgi:thiamine biosynthesis protein ThiI
VRTIAELDSGGGGEPATRPPARRDVLLVRYGEIFLKGDNRSAFLAVLVRNIQRALRELPGLRVERHHARVLVRAMAPEADLEAALPLVTRVFGISSVSLGVSMPRDVEAIAGAGAKLMRESARRGARTFKVHARRSDKRFPVRTPEINDRVGEVARLASGLRVDLDDPDVTLLVEIGTQVAVVAAHAVRGPGGLPVGVSGPVTLLLSGGIDSPVAGYLMQKRGSRLSAVYFHSSPYTGEGAKQKVVELARELGRLQGGIRLSVISFTEIQETMRAKVRPRFLVLLYRRSMMRIASRVAEADGAIGLATGENLGQVASQTLENLSCIEDAAALPVLRPLVAYDKSEIIALAKRIETYETSIRPFEDCCSLFVPRHPVTKGRLAEVRAIEEPLPLAELEERAIAEREILDLEG